jgi:hypothetical protein
MRIGFTGAHRTGKTTTARELAETLHIPFISINIGGADVWKHLVMSDYMTFAERVKVEKELLQYMEDKLSKINTDDFIVDRCPFDVLAYLLANMDHTVSSIFDDDVAHLIYKCCELTDKYFDHFIFVPIAIKCVEEEGKTGKMYLSAAYRHALSNCIIGAYHAYEKSDKLITIPKQVINLHKRIEYILRDI